MKTLRISQVMKILEQIKNQEGDISCTCWDLTSEGGPIRQIFVEKDMPLYSSDVELPYVVLGF